MKIKNRFLYIMVCALLLLEVFMIWNFWKKEKKYMAMQGVSERIFREANEAMGEKKYPVALDKFEEIMKKYPDSIFSDDARYFAGDILLFQMKQVERAKSYFLYYIDHYPEGEFRWDIIKKINFLERYSKNRAAFRVYLDGYSLLEKKKKQKARDLFEKIIREYPADPLADLARKKINKGLKQHDQQ